MDTLTNTGDTLLHLAVQHRHNSVVKMLLGRGVQVYYRSTRRRSALVRSARSVQVAAATDPKFVNRRS